MKKLMVFAVACLASLSMAAFAGDQIKKEDTMEERLAPAGKMCMEGEDCAAAPVATASASAGPRSGQEVYDTKCASCHATGAAGAPKLGDAAGWAPRIGKGIDTLYASAINGFNGMPAKGLCFDCSDEEIQVAVDYLVDGSK